MRNYGGAKLRSETVFFVLTSLWAYCPH